MIYDMGSTGAVSSKHRASVTEQKKHVPVFLLELDLAAYAPSARGEEATMPVSAWSASSSRWYGNTAHSSCMSETGPVSLSPLFSSL